jgi:hypothetical protein
VFKKCECIFDVKLNLYLIVNDNKTVKNLQAAMYRHAVIADRNLTLGDRTACCMEWNLSLSIFTRKYLPLCVYNNACSLKATCTVTGIGSRPNSGPQSRTSFPQFFKLTHRLNSYQKWPLYVRQIAVALSEAWFFYTGVEDETICLVWRWFERLEGIRHSTDWTLLMF